MAHKVEWTVTQNNTDTVYESVEAFFVEEDEALVKQHTDIEIGLVLDKDNTLSEDGKSFVHTKTFDNEENYNAWSTEKAKLSAIDEHLTYTLV
jgi:hypothetical protein